MRGDDERPVHVVVVADGSAGGTLLPQAVAAALPGVTVHGSDTAIERDPPSADCLVIAATVNGVPGIEVLRGLRARGYRGGAVLLAGGDPAMATAVAPLGAVRIVEDGALVESLGEAIAGAVADAGLPGAERAVVARLRHAQQLMAAGAVALRMRHALNNPLAALLAEAQLLEMEPLDAEHRAAVERIIEQCRRLIAVVRQLDGIGSGA